jgi:hypothetical protein
MGQAMSAWPPRGPCPCWGSSTGTVCRRSPPDGLEDHPPRPTHYGAPQEHLHIERGLGLELGVRVRRHTHAGAPQEHLHIERVRLGVRVRVRVREEVGGWDRSVR